MSGSACGAERDGCSFSDNWGGYRETNVRSFGKACVLPVCGYGENGSDPEIILYKKRRK